MGNASKDATKYILSRDWLFFDTNCFSQLVKMSGDGQGSKVTQLVSGKDILLSSNIIQELRHAPDILGALESTLNSSNLFLLPDMATFWYTEISNYLKREQYDPSFSPELHVTPPGILHLALQRPEFEQACLDAEEKVLNGFFDTVKLDIDSNLDERDLCIHIFYVVNKLCKELFQMEVKTEDCTPGRFPSFYSFYYTYYFRYTKNKARPEINDFMDLVNCIPLPYCEKFYGERKFTQIINDHVKGRKPPTPFQLVKRLHKLGWVDDHGFQVIRGHKARFLQTSQLLPGVQIFNFTEMLQDLNNSAR